MNFIDKLKNSSSLLDNFDEKLSVPKNYKNIEFMIKSITADLSEYDGDLNKNYPASDKKEVDILIKQIISKIDKLNEIVHSKLNVYNKFKEQNILK